MKLLNRVLIASFLISFWSASTLVSAAQQDNADSQYSKQETQASPQMQQDSPDAAYDQQQAPPPPAGEQNSQENNSSDAQDAPGRAARLQYMTGSVSLQPHGVNDWVQGSINRPLTNSDNVWADKDSRAELNFGTGLLRIGSETSVTLTNVNENTVQVSLHQGALNVHVRHLFDNEVYEIDTPNQAFTVLQPGDYRFDVDPNGDTTVITVWKGEGEVTGEGSAIRIKAHEQARFTGGTSLTHDIHQAPDPDGFDQWCDLRDRREDNSVSARHVSPDVIGSEDLDDNGTWRDTPEYGSVWTPTSVAPGWAPYTYGNWIWVDPWGWTWQDYSPWGFAPFHYGRWVSYGGGWGWAPGPYYGGWSRGWYSPAMVAWFGGGGWGVGLGFGFGDGFGWCPLGWGEPFHPWYHGGWGYFRNVNIYNTRINNINVYRNGFQHGFQGMHYANMNVRGGFNAVSRSTLERGLPVNRNLVHVPQNALRNAPALSRVSANPTRAAMLGRTAGMRAAVPTSRGFNRPVVSRMGASGNSRASGISASRAPSNGPGIRSVENGTSRSAIAKPSAGRGIPSQSSSAGRSVPQPTQSGINANRAPMSGRSATAGNRSEAGPGRSVPRPPNATGSRSESMSARPGGQSSQAISQQRSMGQRSEQSQMAMNRSVPRPPAGSIRPSSSENSRSSYSGSSARGQGSYSGQGSFNGGLSSRSVPRPSGPVRADTHSYSAPQSNRGYSAGSYGQSSSRGYGGSPYGGSSRASSPYGGSSRGGYSQSSSVYGASRGGSPYSGGYSGHSSSAPSHSSAPSGGGGGYRGGGGGGSSHGGGGGSHGGGGGGGSSHGGGGGGHSGGGHH